MDWYVDINNLDNFTFGGVPSTSFNFAFKADNLKSFERDFELQAVPGRSGDLLIDNKRRKNKTVNVEGVIDCGNESVGVVMRAFNNWLCGEVKYKPLIFSNDLTQYEAIVPGIIEPDEVIDKFVKVKFKFSCKAVE
ncbi:MAG: hypothetical protein KIB00_16165 [Paeniclostridium sordellii]|nr:hypothetical protein [Paeniclostridium sordellii]